MDKTYTATKYSVPAWWDTTGGTLYWMDGPWPPEGLLERWRVALVFPDGEPGRVAESDRYAALALLCRLADRQNDAVLAIAEAMRGGHASMECRGMTATVERLAESTHKKG